MFRKQGRTAETLACVQLSAVQHAEDMPGTQPLSCWAPADAHNSPLPTADSVPAGHYCSLCTFTWTSSLSLDTRGLLQKRKQQVARQPTAQARPTPSYPLLLPGSHANNPDMQGKQTQTLRCVLLRDHQAQNPDMPQATRHKKARPQQNCPLCQTLSMAHNPNHALGNSSQGRSALGCCTEKTKAHRQDRAPLMPCDLPNP